MEAFAKHPIQNRFDGTVEPARASLGRIISSHKDQRTVSWFCAGAALVGVPKVISCRRWELSYFDWQGQHDWLARVSLWGNRPQFNVQLVYWTCRMALTPRALQISAVERVLRCVGATRSFGWWDALWGIPNLTVLYGARLACQEMPRPNMVGLAACHASDGSGALPLSVNLLGLPWTSFKCCLNIYDSLSWDWEPAATATYHKLHVSLLSLNDTTLI